MKKVAILLLAHKNPIQVKRLINLFDKELFDIYIHIDLKVNIEDYKINKSNLYYLNERININWGDNTIAEAMVNLLRESSKKNYIHYVLMSGQDYLIKISKELYKFLSENREYNFNTLIEKNPKFKKRYEIPYLSFMSNNKFLSKVIKNIYQIITGGKNHTFKFLKRKYRDDFSIYFGWNWFSYNQSLVKYIINFLNENPDYNKFMKYVLNSDESYLISIVLNSPFDITLRDGLTYVDWSEGRRNPKTLGLTDLTKLTDSKYYIARKFDIAVDNNVLDALDSMMLGE